MICPFCSLLCDAANLNEIQCDRRTASLVQFESLRSLKAGLLRQGKQVAPAFAERITEATESLRAARRILVTGRIASVATARAAVAFAAKFNATIDCAESGHGFKNVLAIQRSGLNSVSLSEARDHSDFLIVVGDDSMLAACPRLPEALFGGKHVPQTVLLLGDFSIATAELWKNAGFDTWSVPCDVKAVPSSLAQWSLCSDQTPSHRASETHPTKPLFERMAQAMYTTVVWSAENLKFDQADLWVERLLQWIAGRNETTRCAALPWSSLDGTFQQVCTWLTGFPGRVAFRDGIPQYDPNGHSYEQWISRTPVGMSLESIVVLIDETASLTPFLNSESMRAFGLCKVIELTGNSSRFPTAIAGLEVLADIFRADQTLLARVLPERKLCPSVKTAAEWLEGLSQ